MKKIWGTISGGGLNCRGYFDGNYGLPDMEPWFTTKDGDKWSGYDVNFRPDDPATFEKAYKKVKEREAHGYSLAYDEAAFIELTTRFAELRKKYL